jgi:FtsP/CotA-like multicopper oxidase with cupredoxin domain
VLIPRLGGSRAQELPPPATPGEERVTRLDLVAAERPTALLCFGGASLPLWTFSATDWLPIVRLRLGDRVVARFRNELPRDGEHSSIHWHGLRIANDQDGVPFMTQPPVFPGEVFDYSFVPPDTGTFFFHPHCNTAEQLGRGLAGVMVVEGDETIPYDADEVIVLRDWRLDDASSGFRAFRTDAGAAKAGSFGTVRSANGATNPEITLPAGGDCRLRILNLDNTRVMQVGVEGAEAALIAVDGIALPPIPLKAWRLGPAMRIDIVVRAPMTGETVRLVDYFASEPAPLVRLTGGGEPRQREEFDPAPLRAARMPAPDLGAAERLSLAFSASAVGEAVADAAADGAILGSLCSADGAFWAINNHAWPGGDHAHVPPPLALLERGRTYICELVNRTPHQHPIHIHGHTFKLLRSSERDLPVHHADTVLLQPKERLEVAFVADNPGDWMLHCHIIEHQETGMMGYLRVA